VEDRETAEPSTSTPTLVTILICHNAAPQPEDDNGHKDEAEKVVESEAWLSKDEQPMPCRSKETPNCDFIAEDACRSPDAAQWFPLTTATVDYWLKHGPQNCRHETATNSYPASARRYNLTTKEPRGRIRRFNNRLFYSTAPNGEQEAQLNARGGRPYCPQSHKYNHAVRI